MKIGIISDIHGNLEALERVREELKDVEKIVCLGDIVGYGANPNECCEIIQEISDLTILGNHDLAVLGEEDIKYFNPYAAEAILWTQKVLSESNLKFLAKLKMEEYFSNTTFVHGSLYDYSAYIHSSESAYLNFLSQQTPVCFIGHTHISEFYLRKKESLMVERRELFSGGEIKITEENFYIINCGSVGQPRDRNPKASFGIYDTEKNIVQVKRVDYPVEIASKKIEKAGLPPFLSKRLFIGY
jgi:predicted phosphodiesterase